MHPQEGAELSSEDFLREKLKLLVRQMRFDTHGDRPLVGKHRQNIQNKKQHKGFRSVRVSSRKIPLASFDYSICLLTFLCDNNSSLLS